VFIAVALSNHTVSA